MASAETLVEDLGVPHRARAAHRELLQMGRQALPSVTRGLDHDKGAVRAECTRLMDRLALTESFELLKELCEDPEPWVRINALHALACDRCKEDDVCALDAADVLPIAIEALERDPDDLARAMAAEVVGRYAHSDDAAAEALVTSHRSDPSPAVRKKAGWFAPGGVRYMKTMPKPARSRRP